MKARYLMLFVTVACLTPLSGWCKDVYLAARGDNKGSGTQSYPYDAASADRLDAVIAQNAVATTFHYAAGTYSTHGYYFQHPNVHAGCLHRGAGIDKTVIRLVGPTSGKAPSGLMFGADYNNSADGFEMHDLTLDCNAANNPIFKGGTGAVSAVSIQGNNVLFQNLKVIGFGTSRKGTECFVFWSYPGSAFNGKTFRNVKLDAVTFTAPAHGNRDGCTITVLGAAQGVNVVNTQILNCQYLDCDSDFTYCHTLGALDNENNYVRNCTQGAYFETADRQDRTFVYRNNRFENVEKAVFINWHPNAYIGGIIFDNNTVSVRPNAPNNSALGVNDDLHNGDAPSKIGSIEFENNTVTLASYGQFSSVARAIYLHSPGHHYTVGTVNVANNKVSGLPTGEPYSIQADIVGSLSVH